MEPRSSSSEISSNTLWANPRRCFLRMLMVLSAIMMTRKMMIKKHRTHLNEFSHQHTFSHQHAFSLARVNTCTQLRTHPNPASHSFTPSMLTHTRITRLHPCAHTIYLNFLSLKSTFWCKQLGVLQSLALTDLCFQCIRNNIFGQDG